MMNKFFAVVLFLLSGCLCAAGQNAVSGKVVDEAGLPMIGAGVLIQGSNRGVVTDMDGKYSITLQNGENVLVFSYLGYAEKSVLVDGRSIVDVSLAPDASTSLNDVVVIGYGTTKKSDLTGSVSTVKMSEIADTPTTSIDQALQGRIAGVDVMTTTGEPGASTSIRVRGTRSIEASNEPLIVVDGVIDAIGDLSEINPDDIESINILKDASSTAIYGSRGANGVIIITTRKGITSRPSVTAKVTFGVSQLARKLDLMNTEELIRYRNDISYIDAYSKTLNPESFSAPRPSYDPADYKNDTDWVKAITRTGFSTTANLSISGKSGKTTYFASGALNDTQGIVDGSGFTRITGRLNLSHEFTNWLSIALKLNHTYSIENPNKANIGGTNTYTGAIYLAPYIGAYDEVNPLYENGTRINTPVVAIEQIDYTKNRRNTSASGEITLTPVKGLVITSQNTYTPMNVDVYKYSPSTLPARYEGQGGLAQRSIYKSLQLMSENTATYTARFGRNHRLKAMAGFSVCNRMTENVAIDADGIIDDSLKWNNLNAVNTKEGYTIQSEKAQIIRESFYTRINYDFKNRYYLTFTARADGSSNFAANSKWAFFPSGAFKWSVKKEEFLRNVRWLDELSIRLSAGVTGNDAISAYRSLGVYASSTSGAVFEGSQSAGFYPNRVANPDLTWEKTTSYNIGVDFSAFDNRLNITAEAYSSRTKDLLLTLKIIQSTGFSSRLTNLGATSNVGGEITINSVNIERKNFGWQTDLTLSHNSQLVESIGHEAYVSVMNSGGYMMYGYKKNYPLNALWGFQYAGVFHSKEEAEQAYADKKYVSQTIIPVTETKDKEGNITKDKNYNILAGRSKYVDQDHNGILSNDDLVYLGNADPILFGGIQNTFDIYKFKVGVYFAYSLGGKIYNYSELLMSGGTVTNQYAYMTDSWHPVRNPDSNIPRAGAETRNLPSSFMVHDASYLRLKTVNVSYTFDFKKLRKPVVRSITLGLTGENLWLWTKYNGFDPDVSSSEDSSTIRRADVGAYPRARQIVANLQIKF